MKKIIHSIIIRLAMIRGVLFDKDGTLIDLNGPWLQSIIDYVDRLSRGNHPLSVLLAQAAGIDLINRRVIPFSPLAQGPFRQVAKALHQVLSSETKTALSEEEILQQMKNIANTNLGKPVPIEGAIWAIATLTAQGLPVGIISNDRAEHIHHALTELKIDRYISYIRGSDSGCGHKPAPDMVHQFCDEFALQPKEVLVVGDSLVDMETAQMAGCDHIVAIHPDTLDTQLRRYTPHILPDLTELPNIIKQINQ